MWIRHAPVVSLARRLFGLSQRSTQHHSVRTAGERLAQVTARPNTAIRDYRHVASRPVKIFIPRGGAVNRRAYLRNTYASNFPGCACSSGTDTHQHAVDARFHEFERHLVGYAVAHQHRDIQHLQQFREPQSARAVGDMPGGRNRGLHDDHVSAGFGCRRSQLLRICRSNRNGAHSAVFLCLFYPLTHKFLSDGGGVELLQESGYLVLRRCNNLAENLVRVVIPSLHALEVHYSKATQFAHLTGELWGADRVHSGGKHRRLKCNAVNREVGADQLGVDGYLSRHDCDFIESIDSS